jgi:hypothetical protein
MGTRGWWRRRESYQRSDISDQEARVKDKSEALRTKRFAETKGQESRFIAQKACDGEECLASLGITTTAD